MKVILLKDTKEGKTNQVIEVSSGYGSNFLIPKGLAVLYNNETKHLLNQKLNHLNAERKIHLEKMHDLKQQIENLKLEFALKVSGDVIHHSITRKQIFQVLSLNKINIKPQQIENIKVNTLGISLIPIKLDKQVIANLKIQVVKDDK